MIGLENGKLAHLIIGSCSTEELKNRKNYRAILTNIPSIAQETLLLRALHSTGAKAVYISFNSNRNSSRIAKVFFRTKEDMEDALSRNIYYYNTKLLWKENRALNTRVPREQKPYRSERENSTSRNGRIETTEHINRREEKIRKTDLASSQSTGKEDTP